MGKKRAEDEDLRVGPEGDPGRGLNNAKLDPSAHDQSVRTRSFTSNRKREEIIDPAAMTRASAAAYEAGAAATRISFEVLGNQQTKAIDGERVKSTKLEERIERLQDKNAELADKLVKLSSTSTKQADREADLALEKAKDENWHKSLRHIADKAGPGVGPVLTAVLRQVMPQATPLLESGSPGTTSNDKTPAAAVARLVAKLRSGTDEANGLLGILADFTGEEDWPLVLAYLVQLGAKSSHEAATSPVH